MHLLASTQVWGLHNLKGAAWTSAMGWQPCRSRRRVAASELYTLYCAGHGGVRRCQEAGYTKSAAAGDTLHVRRMAAAGDAKKLLTPRQLKPARTEYPEGLFCPPSAFRLPGPRCSTPSLSFSGHGPALRMSVYCKLLM